MNTLATQKFRMIDDQDVAVMTYEVIDRIHGIVAKSGHNIRTWARRANERRALARLNDRMLSDTGLTRVEIDRECRKYFWQK